MSEPRDPEVQALLDKQAIHDVLVGYCRGADRADLELIAAAYHPDAIEDHGGTYKGPAKDYVAQMAGVLPGARFMSHSTTNILIELDGDVGHVESHILTFSRMRKDGEKFETLTLARAIDRFEKRGGALTTMSAIINEDAPVAPHAGHRTPWRGQGRYARAGTDRPRRFWY